MLLQSLYFSRLLPNRPYPLSTFDTHARWQPVTQSARSRWSYGRIEDCEQSRSDTVPIFALPSKHKLRDQTNLVSIYLIKSVVHLIVTLGLRRMAQLRVSNVLFSVPIVLSLLACVHRVGNVLWLKNSWLPAYFTGHMGVICDLDWLKLNFTIDYHISPLFFCCKIEQTVIRSTYIPGTILFNDPENR